MADRIRMGVIGIGNMGSGHCLNIVSGKTPEIELTAVADGAPSRRAWARENLPAGVEIYEDGHALIAGGRCDAALIATPHYQHPELALDAFAHGLHVLCEKPIAVYTLAGREMIRAAEASGKVFALMYNQRTNCVYRRMKALLTSGELGQIRRVNWIITDWFRAQSYYDSGAWRATWAGEGGGALLNQCPHQLDLLQWLCGLPVKVRAFCHEGKWHDIEVEDDVTAYMEFENGATGVFITSTGDLPGTNRLEITTDGGKLVCEHDQLRLWKLSTPTPEFLRTSPNGFAKPDAEEILVQTDGENPQHVGVLNAFAANILRGEPLVAEGAEGLRGLMLSNAMHLSSWLGETVTLPIDEERFLELLNARRGVKG